MDEMKAAAEEILGELAPLFFEHMAAAEWGRILVSIAPRAGEGYRVTDIQVEDITGDEARIDAVFGGPDVYAMLPAIDHACEALCATEGVDPGDLDGCTFLRREGGQFAFLPGLVRAPSDGFEKLRGEHLGPALARQRELAERFGLGARFHFDLEAQRITFEGPRGEPVARARALILGTFSLRSRTWVWAWANPSLASQHQAAARDLCDRFPRRDLWEISTPQFASDEGTIWALASLVTALGDPAGPDPARRGVYRAPMDGGSVFLLLDAVEAVGP